MIDQTSQFFAMLTAIGEAKHANAIALGVDWMFTDMGVGDANGTDPIPDRLQTQLINEWRRAPVNQIRVDAANPNVVITEQIIPADVGGKWIREIGLYDIDGDLVAVANCAPSFKPLLSQGSGKTQVVRMNFIVTSAASIVLKIDPAVVLATREYVDQKVKEEIAKLDHKESVLYATTGAIMLSGLGVQAGGDWAAALSAGARVLVKDQAAAKDNGLYSAAAGAWMRTADADSSADVTSGLVVAVEQGATLADTRWQLVTDGNVVLGTTALTFKTANNPTATTAPQFDNSKLIATTEFVRRQGLQYSGGVVSGSGSSVMNASHIGGIYYLYLATDGTITLPPTAGVPVGATVTLMGNMNAGITATLTAGIGGVLRLASGLAIPAPVTMKREEVAVFQMYAAGGEWRLVGGTLAMRYAAAGPEANFITMPRFDNSQALVTTEFLKRQGLQYSGFAPIIGATPGLAEHIGGVVHCSSGSGNSYSLPDSTANKLPPGATVRIQNWSTVIIGIGVQGADLIQEGINFVASNAIRSMPPDTYIDAMFVGGGVWLFSGTGVYGTSQPFGALFNEFSGYQRLPSGLIVQGGRASNVGQANSAPGSVGPTQDLAFPVTFPNKALWWAATMEFATMSTVDAYTPGMVVLSPSTFRIQNNYTSSAGQIKWIAFGY